MANKFDIDSSADTHLLNETFHVFSKSPASNGTTLGGARLKSGHTTTASDIWADEIPAFFNAANQAKFDLFSTLAVKDDLCIFGGNVYQHNGTQFVSLGTEAEVLVDGKTFSKNNKPVVKYHKSRTAINLTADNNNGDGSNNLSAKIYDAATGSTNFVSQFISSTDKMVAGVPSLGYDATVIAGGVKLAEGLTNDNDYICNAYAGVIQFNKARSSGVTVSAWEYIGDKLTTSLNSIREDVQDIIGTTMEGVVASVGTTSAAENVGISVDSSSKTSPKIDITTGTVGGSADAKLVTGSTVKTYVDTAVQSAAITVNDTTGVKTITVAGTTDEIVVTPSGSGTSKTLTLSLSDKVATTAQIEAAEGRAAADATTKANAAQTAAEATAATDATAKANAAQVAAEATAAADATSKANAAKEAAISAAATDATNKANTAKSEAIAAAATDATNKVNEAKTEITAITNGLATRIGNLEGVAKFKVSVGALPETLTDEHENTIFLVEDGAESGTYTEWLVYRTSDDSLTSEKIGTTATDLSEYAKTATVDAELAKKATQADLTALTARVTTAEDDITSLENSKADASSVYTKGEVDTKISGATLSVTAGALTKTSGSLTIAGGTGISVTGANDTATIGIDTATKSTIDGAVQSVSGDTYVTLTKTGTAVSATTNLSALTTAIDTALAASGSVKNAIDAKADASIVTALSQTVADNATTATTGINEAKAAAKSANDKAVAAQTAADNAQTAANSAQTTANAAKALGEAAATKTALEEVEGKIPETYVESVNGLSSEVTIASGRTTDTPALSDVTTWGAVSIEKTSNNDAISINGNTLWNSNDTLNCAGDATYFINNVGYNANGKVVSFVHYDTCTQAGRIIGGLNGGITSFVTDLPNLIDGTGMFYGNSNLKVFRGSLGSLSTATEMFSECTLDEDSVMYIADGIKDWGTPPTEVHNITIDVDSSLTSDATIAGYFAELAQKGWTVVSNYSSVPATAATTGTSNGIYAIAHSVNTPERATHITAEGNYVRLETATSVIGPHQHLWSAYPSVEDAILDMELTAI